MSRDEERALFEDRYRTFCPGGGLSERGVKQALHRNDHLSNVNAISLEDRERDREFYANMPMNDDSGDPINDQVQSEHESKLLATLTERAESLTKSAEATPTKPVVSWVEPDIPRVRPGRKNPFRACLAAIRGCADDLERWDELPEQGRFRRVVGGDGRFPYLVGLLIILVLAATLVQKVH